LAPIGIAGTRTRAAFFIANTLDQLAAAVTVDNACLLADPQRLFPQIAHAESAARLRQMRAANPGRTRFENGGTDDNTIQNATVVFLEGFPVENEDESAVQIGQSTHARLLDPTGQHLAQSQRIHVAQLIVAGAENGPGVVSDDVLQAGYRHDHFAKKKFEADENPDAVQSVRNAFDEPYCSYLFQGSIAV
jgi:hypothetical protein